MRGGLALVCRHARILGFGIGLVSLSLGLALTLAPRKTAGLLGWEDRELLARVIGAADLIVGTGLLLSQRSSHWMLARTLLNVVIGGSYIGVLRAGTPDRRRAIGGVCMMGVLTVNDYYLSRCLQEIEASYGLTEAQHHSP